MQFGYVMKFVQKMSSAKPTIVHPTFYFVFIKMAGRFQIDFCNTSADGTNPSVDDCLHQLDVFV